MIHLFIYLILSSLARKMGYFCNCNMPFKEFQCRYLQNDRIYIFSWLFKDFFLKLHIFIATFCFLQICFVKNSQYMNYLIPNISPFKISRFVEKKNKVYKIFIYLYKSYSKLSNPISSQ